MVTFTRGSDEQPAGQKKRFSVLADVLRSRLATNATWNVIGAVFNQGSTFALGIVVAKALGREPYGSFAFLQGTLLMFTSIAQLALGFATIKYVSEYRALQRERAGRIIGASLSIALLTGFVAMALAAGGSQLLASRAAHQPQLAPLILFGSPTIFFTTVGAILTGVLAGLERFRTIAVTGVIAGIAYIALGTAGALKLNLRGVAIALAMSAALQCFILLLAARREARRFGIEVRPGGIADIRAESEALIHVTLPSTLIGFTYMGGLWVAMAILARQQNGITQVALFNAANTLRVLVNFVPALINSVGFPLLSSRKGEADKAGYRRAFRANLAAVVGVALCGAIAVAVVGPLILRLYGPSFLTGYPVLLILLLATIPEAAAIAAYQVVQTHGSIWWTLLYVALPRDLTTIVAVMLLAPRFGAAGLAGAILLGTLFGFCGAMMLFFRVRHLAMAEAA